MKKSLTIFAALAVLAIYSAAASAKEGHISKSALAEMGLSGLSVMSDEAASKIRGKGFDSTYGGSVPSWLTGLDPKGNVFSLIANSNNGSGNHSINVGNSINIFNVKIAGWNMGNKGGNSGLGSNGQGWNPGHHGHPSHCTPPPVCHSHCCFAPPPCHAAMSCTTVCSGMHSVH